MSSADHPQGDELNDVFDARVMRQDGPPHAIDLATGEVVRRFFAADDAPAPPSELAGQIWETLMNTSQAATSFPQLSQSAVPPPTNGWHSFAHAPAIPAPGRAAQRPRFRYLNHLLAAVALGAVLVGFFTFDPFGMRSGPATTVPAVIAPAGVDADNPIIGTWTFDQDVTNPGNDYSYITFTSDGTVIDAEPTLDTYLGVWTATGPNTVEIVTYSQNITDRPGLPKGRGRLAASFELDVSGTSFTGTYVYKFVQLDGSPMARLQGSSSGHKVTMDWVDGTPTP